ncbi:MAG: hypothetical protein COT24_03015 [Candidatus Kerfeldbacteria bacterium CG08_land_8_20_14_0_20_40_16]|uniref:Putative gluconeogenesis factor n=1 Tax=Candidatus Kerfeldbacteria bacterium CG08_land_8_20_14_0_20_40_16 TaxID=2014244 RepID=A0A2H0YXQ8_9BACT|nr:MAG: hypothetical protein COT24_03015 [Candidatus Kerfeldbacteria bacterium CG08_land_8_20_14_0_20_40_16]
MRKKRAKIVTIGGGTGSSQVLLELKKYPVQLSAIVTMMDSGGSTGQLVKEAKVHPMGDVRQALLALSKASPDQKEFFDFRFARGGLRGHNLGNMILAAFEKATGNFEKSIEIIKRFLTVKGDVIPVTLEFTDLVAYLKNGKKLVREDRLELLTKKSYSFKRLGLTHKVKANPKAIKAIREAEIIIIGPGNPLRSILPNFLVTGIKSAVKKSKAKAIFLANLMNKKGQTDQLTLSESIAFYEQYIGKGVIDYVVYNSADFSKDLLRKYQLKDESLLKIDKDNLQRSNYKAIGAPLLAKGGFSQKKEDVLLTRTAIRHDPKKLAKIIMRIISERKK